MDKRKVDLRGVQGVEEHKSQSERMCWGEGELLLFEDVVSIVSRTRVGYDLSR